MSLGKMDEAGLAASGAECPAAWHGVSSSPSLPAAALGLLDLTWSRFNSQKTNQEKKKVAA